MEELIEKIRVKALKDSVPIMESDTLYYIVELCQNNQIKTMLEVGTAVGYSASVLAYYNPQLKIVTLERDQARFDEAKENIAQMGLSNRISQVLTDAREYNTDEMFDLILLDGPKAHNQELLERYEKNLNPKGIVIVDDVYFHGYCDNPSLIQTRRLRVLVRKLNKFKEDLEKNPDYEVTYLQAGDGLLIAKRRY